MSDTSGGGSRLARWYVPARVGLIYVVFGVAWIAFSDAVLLSLAPDLASVRFYGLAKGDWFCLPERGAGDGASGTRAASASPKRAAVPGHI